MRSLNRTGRLGSIALVALASSCRTAAPPSDATEGLVPEAFSRSGSALAPQACWWTAFGSAELDALVAAYTAWSYYAP